MRWRQTNTRNVRTAHIGGRKWQYKVEFAPPTRLPVFTTATARIKKAPDRFQGTTAITTGITTGGVIHHVSPTRVCADCLLHPAADRIRDR
jgi:hypothetical protein